MIGKAIAGFAAALTFAVTATVAGAAGPAGGGGHFGGMGGMGGFGGFAGMGAMGAMSATGMAAHVHGGGRIGGGSFTGAGPMMSGLGSIPFPTNDPRHYHEIKLIGRLAKDESGLTIDQQIVRIRLDGRTIPMFINGDAMSNGLQLDQGDELGQILYRLILSKQLEVVGDQKLRTQIANAAAATPPKQVLLDGFVYDRVTPYLVLVSVEDAP